MEKKNKNFINEIIEVCKKHDRCLSFQEIYHSFCVTCYDEDLIEWLKQAEEET